MKLKLTFYHSKDSGTERISLHFHAVLFDLSSVMNCFSPGTHTLSDSLFLFHIYFLKEIKIDESIRRII